jgi:predicted PurR-regulated permease PerM
VAEHGHAHRFEPIPTKGRPRVTDRGPFLSSPLVARAARWGLLAWSVIGVVVLVAGFFWYVLRPIRIVFPPLVVALIVVYLLNPLVGALERRGVRRVWGTLLLYVVLLSAVGVLLSFLIPVASHQVAQFSKGIPDLLTRFQQGLDAFAKRLGIKIDTGNLVQLFRPGTGEASIFLSRITSFTSGVVRAAFVLLLGPLIAFYLLMDLPKIRRSVRSLIPANRRVEATVLGRRVGQTFGGFFRGQLLVAFLVGLFSMLGFWAIGLPYFVVVGLLTALFTLVPLVGIVIAAIPALFVALTTSGHTGGLLHVRGGWPLALATIVVLIMAQELDTRVLGPRLLDPSLRLHPITVLLSLLVGGSLLGLWGMLLAVPIVMVGKVIVLYVWDTRSQWPPAGGGRARDEGHGEAAGGAHLEATGEARMEAQDEAHVEDHVEDHEAQSV